MVTVAGSRLYNESEAANYLGIKEQTLALWRSAKRYDLPYIKVGRSVRYRLSDLEGWVKSRTVGRSDSEE